jgi:hypothetical protein
MEVNNLRGQLKASDLEYITTYDVVIFLGADNLI